MSKNNAANVIDLEALRQRKLRAESVDEGRSRTSSVAANNALFVPVWFCWVPVWSPVLG